MNEKVQKLLADEAFVEQMLNAASAEEVSALFTEQGVNLSVKEVEIIQNSLSNYSGKDELSEQELANVAGGEGVDLGLIDDVINGVIKLSSGLFERISSRRW